MLALIRADKMGFDVVAVLHDELGAEDLREALETGHSIALKGLTTLLHSAHTLLLGEESQLAIALDTFQGALFPHIPPQHRDARVLQLIQSINCRLTG